MRTRSLVKWLLAAAGIVAVAAIAIALVSRGNQPVKSPQAGALRIVSLAPSVTEIIFALGLGECLVGATQYCTWPPEAKRIERVGGFGTPNVERLLALRPDLVVAAGLERKEAAEALRQAGIRVLDVTIRNFEELFAAILEIGKEAGRPSQAEALVKTMRAELDAVARRYASVPQERRPRVFVEIWHDPLTTAGAASFLNDLVSRAGGVNVAGALPQPHPRVNPEKVIEWDPDFIVTAYMARPGRAAAQVASRIGWAGIKAVKNGRIIDDIPADLLLRSGPRLVEGVKALAVRLYPLPAAGVSREAGP